MYLLRNSKCYPVIFCLFGPNIFRVILLSTQPPIYVFHQGERSRPSL